MKRIVTILVMVALLIATKPVLAVYNVWTGFTSTAWNVATNWSLGHVPLAAEDVSIPAAPANQPVISGVTAVCTQLTISDGASLAINATTLNDATLTATGATLISGGLTIGGTIQHTAKMVLHSMEWRSNATFTGYLNSSIEISGFLSFEAGSSITLGLCPVKFVGSLDPYIMSKSNSSSLGSVSVNMTSGHSLYIHALSTATLFINGGVNITAGTTLVCDATISTTIKGNITNNGAFKFNNGTVNLQGTSATQTIQVTPTSYFNNLNIEATGTVTLNNDLIIKGFLGLQSGVLDPLNHKISIMGDWYNNTGTDGFVEGTGRVVFNSSTANQSCETETFNILEINKSGGLFRVYGEDVTCAQYDWTAGTLSVENYGTFTANDLADAGIFGNYYITPGSTINLHQDIYSLIDLCGNLNFASGGAINIYGGGSACEWASYGNASIIMNEGVLDFKDQGFTALTTAPYALTTNITGGKIRTTGNVYSNRADLNPTGGLIEMYGAADAELTFTGGKPYDLKILKEAANTVTLNSNLSVNGSLSVTTGNLIADNKILTANGSVLIFNTGVLKLGPGTQLKIMSGSVSVYSGGTLQTWGNLADNVVLTRSGITGSYEINLNTGSTVSAKYTTFQYMNGMRFNAGSMLDPANALYHCTFSNNVGTNTLLFSNTQVASVHEAYFPNLGSTYNVQKSNNSGRITFKDATGAYAGGAYENDPYNRVDWSASTPGLWTGMVSADWYTPANWDDYTVPVAATNVTIPAGVPNMPLINSGDGYCNNIVIQAGATLTVGNGDLNVAGDMTVHGQVAETNSNADIFVTGSVLWESGSTANVTAGEFRITGDWEFRNGTNAQLTGGTVLFTGGGLSYIRSHEHNAAFNNLTISKTAGTLYYSNTSTDTLKINGTLSTTSSTSYFTVNATIPLLLRGQLSNIGHIYCPSGTFIFDGTTHTIDLNTDDYFNNVIISSSGNTSLADSLRVRGNLVIESGTLVANTFPIIIRGNWTNTVGTEGYSEGSGVVTFEGPAASDILTDETFYQVVLDKTYTGLDGLEINDSITVANDLLIMDGTLEMNPGGRLYVYGEVNIAEYAGLNANDDNVVIYCGDDWIDNNLTTSTTIGFNAGPYSIVHFLNKAGIQYIQEYNTFNNLIINGIGTYTRPNLHDLTCRNMSIAGGVFRLYNYKATVTSNFTVGAGTLRMDLPDDSLVVTGNITWQPGSTDVVTDGLIIANGDWTFENGTSASLGTGNTVKLIREGATLITCLDADASFGTLVIGKPSGPSSDTYLSPSSTDTIRVAGSMTVYTGNQFHIQDRKLSVTGLLDIASNAELDFLANGYLLNKNSTFTLNGKLNIGSGTALFHGTFEEAATGILTIAGGSFTSDAPISVPAWQYISGSFTLSSGSFTIVNNSIGITATATTAVSGGTITTGGAFAATVTGTFQPTGGTVKFLNPGTAAPNLFCNNGNYLHNLEISGNVVMQTDITIRHDMFINSGYLNSNTFDIYVEGNWTNNVGPDGFGEQSNAVLFTGAYDANILTNETFFDMYVEKTNTSINALELYSNLTLHITHNLGIVDGSFELNSNSVLDIDNSFEITAGAGLNADDSPLVTINIGRNWTNGNATYSTNYGFNPGNFSVVTFKYSNDQYLTTAATQEEFYDLRISKGGGEFRPNDNLLAFGDIEIQSGTWEDNIAGLTHHVYGDFSVNSTGAFLNAFPQNTVEFSGSGNSVLSYNSLTGCFHDIVINKTTGVLVTQATDISCLFTGGFTIANGKYNVNGHTLWVEHDLVVNDAGTLTLPAASILVMKTTRTLGVNPGGRLEIIGTSSNPVTLRADVPTAYYAITISPGGTIAADYGIFKNLFVNGVNLLAGSTVDPAHTFKGCTFQDGFTGGTLLTVNNDQVFTVRNAVFPTNSWGGTSNVKKTVGVGHVYFVDFSGGFSGEDFDLDPSNLIDWVTPLVATASSTPHAICAGSSSQLNVVPAFGLPPYSYLWSPAAGLSNPAIANPVATPANTIMYYVTVTDNLGSTATSWAEVLVSPMLMPVISIEASANPSPPGNYVTFSSTAIHGGTSPSYQWKVNGINAGTGASGYSYIPDYNDQVTCELTSNYMCPITNPVTSNTITMVVVPVNTPVSGTVTPPASNCYDASNTIMVGGAGGPFTVQSGASAIMIAGFRISYQYGTAIQPGGYLHGYITTTNAYCGSLPPPMVAVVAGSGAQAGSSAPAGSSASPAEVGEPVEPTGHFTLYPNPTNVMFTLQYKGNDIPGKVKVEMFDMRGSRHLSEFIPGERSHRFNVTGLAPGFYFIKVDSGTAIQSFKLIVTR